MNKIFEKAIKIAKKVPKQKYTLVAIIVDKKGKILSVGKNSYKKSHPTQAYYAEKTGNIHRIYLHAEISAIINLPRNSEPYAIYIVRTDYEGNPVLSKPCQICQNAINDVGIENIFYTG